METTQLCCEMYVPEYERRDVPFVPRRLVINIAKLDLSKTIRAFDVVSEYKTDDKKQMRGEKTRSVTQTWYVCTKRKGRNRKKMVSLFFGSCLCSVFFTEVYDELVDSKYYDETDMETVERADAEFKATETADSDFEETRSDCEDEYSDYKGTAVKVLLEQNFLYRNRNTHTMLEFSFYIEQKTSFVILPKARQL